MMLLTGRAEESARQLELTMPAVKPVVFERVEIPVAGMPDAAHPFDPEQITLDVEVTSPSGKSSRTPGYYARDFDRKLEGHHESLSPKGTGGWRLRWLPLEPGPHAMVFTATRNGKPEGRAEAVIDVARGNRHGLARVEPAAKRTGVIECVGQQNEFSRIFLALFSKSSSN